MKNSISSDNGEHLGADEVIQILKFVSRYSPIVVGGQSVNIWSELFQGRDKTLDELGNLTSKDLDFYQNKAAQEALASSLAEGKLHLPDKDDHTPNASVVTGKIGDRLVEIDFLANVLGVEDKSLRENSLTIRYDDEDVSVTLMHPLDCIRSRLANINRLGRRSKHSLSQALASIRILACFMDDLLNGGKPGHQLATDILGQLEYVLRDEHIGEPSHTEFGEMLGLEELLRSYLHDTRLNERYRDRQLAGIMARTEERLAKAIARPQQRET